MNRLQHFETNKPSTLFIYNFTLCLITYYTFGAKIDDAGIDNYQKNHNIFNISWSNIMESTPGGRGEIIDRSGNVIDTSPVDYRVAEALTNFACDYGLGVDDAARINDARAILGQQGIDDKEALWIATRHVLGPMLARFS